MEQLLSSQAVTPAYISLGSNQGDSKAVLEQALACFRTHAAQKTLPLFQVAAHSPLYTTEPQLYSEQPYFTNQIVQLNCDTTCTPLALLQYLQSVELALGRVRTDLRYGPRVIDLDIVLFGDMTVTTDVLKIPHARMHERAFVLVPLCDIAPNLVTPHGRSIQSLLEALSYSVVENTIFQP